MKKILTLLLSALLIFTSLFGFGCKEDQINSYIFIAPDGAPALAIAKLIHDSDDLGTNKTVDYKVVNSGQVQPNLASGKADFIVAPVNLASKLYKASGADHYVMVAVLTHGNFYIMSTEQITVNDLVGKRVAVPNMGAVPDWTFKMVLENYGLSYAQDTDDSNKVNIKYYTEGQVIVSSILGEEESVGLVPEPAASALERQMTAQSKSIYRIDLQELYDSQEKSYPQAVLMVKKSVLNDIPNLVNTLQTKIIESATWIKADTNSAVTAVNANGGVSLKAPALTEKAINGCNIYWQSAESAKLSVKNYIDKIINIDSTKATAVKDDFFYNAK